MDTKSILFLPQSVILRSQNYELIRTEKALKELIDDTQDFKLKIFHIISYAFDFYEVLWCGGK